MRAAADANQFQHGELRKGEALACDLENQRGNDRKRQRNFDDKTRATPGDRRNVHSPTDLLDITAHDVHSDASAGNARYLCGGGEAWSEDKVVDFGLWFRRDLGFACETGFECLGPDARGVEAAAIVGNLNHDVPALPRRSQPARTLAGLACGASLRRALDAVAAPIGDQFRRRFFAQTKTRRTQFGIAAVLLNLAFLP